MASLTLLVGRKKRGQSCGFILVTVLMLLAVLSSLVASYMLLSNIELGTTKGSNDTQGGFNAAEAGLNVRAETIRTTFVGYNLPSGTSPTTPNQCTAGNMGVGTYACQVHDFGKHSATSYVAEEPGNPITLAIPAGELYQGLNAQEYRYDVRSVGRSDLGDTQAILNLRFKSRLVPLFQFAVFYNKDLEILPGQTMTLTGPVHTNGDLYLDTGASLDISGQVSTAGSLYRGRKNDASCSGSPVRVKDPTTARTLPACAGRRLINQSQLTPWNGMIQTKVLAVTVPQPEDFDPTPGKKYWDKSDLRLVLKLTAADGLDTANSATGIEIRKADNTVDAAKTNTMNACVGTIPAANKVAAYTTTMYNNRESKWIKMLDVDLKGIFDCTYANNILDDGKLLNDSTEGGLVFFLTVDGPNKASAANAYGVRVRNGQELKATNGAAPAIKGLTIISDQAAYVFKDFNSINKKPAAFMVDSFNVLSTTWDDAKSNQVLANRVPGNTAINAAILAGTSTTGNVEGTGGQGGAYNGGLENYPRFHENWNGTKTLTYFGSFVSLNKPRHVNGGWVYGGSQYTAPIRAWSYDTMFNDASKLPPLSPRFVYLRQELFVRDYEMETAAQ